MPLPGKLLPTLLAPLAVFAGSVVPPSAAAATGLHWVYEAVGDDAPRQERFVVGPTGATWLDPMGRVQWRLDRTSAALLQVDPGDGRERRMDEAAVAGLAAALAQARAALPHGAAAPRAWAAVETADRWTPLDGTARVAGVECRRVALHQGLAAVGETCIAEPSALPGGHDLMALLQALQRLADAVQARAADGRPGPLPLHPLVSAARTGGLPLSVSESLPGERRRAWRLAAPPSAQGGR